ncbi:unnamed protein product [Agarophyton chilense]
MMCASVVFVVASLLRRLLPIALAFALALSSGVRAHGAMVLPRQRGALQQSRYIPSTIDPDAPRDFYPHFPAGVKNDLEGVGEDSQKQAAGSRGWYPYDPYDPNFVWRAGVCGDTVAGPQHHLIGGEFYHGAQLVARYRQGATIGIGLSLIAHHNGFIEAHLCDVSKCPGGDISKECFVSSACTQLNRAVNPECDSGTSMHCGPIDRNYPGRWYMPCTTNSALGYDYYPPEYATFQLPSNFFCEHCVLQWYWAAANDCNPPGVLDYFDGPDRPDWQQCPGQGDARGGVTRNKQPCGGPEYFAEEYYQCADVQIVPLSGARSGVPQPVSAEALELSPQATSTASGDENAGRSYARMKQFGDGVFESLLFWADNIPSRALKHDTIVDISVYKRVGVEAKVTRNVDEVQFYVDGEVVHTARSAPYFMFRTSDAIPAYWDDVPVNRPVTIGASADGEMAEVTVTFVR